MGSTGACQRYLIQIIADSKELKGEIARLLHLSSIPTGLGWFRVLHLKVCRVGRMPRLTAKAVTFLCQYLKLALAY